MISPWKINDLPEEWIEAAYGLTLFSTRLAQRRAADHEVERVKSAWRSQHPNYRRN